MKMTEFKITTNRDYKICRKICRNTDSTKNGLGEKNIVLKSLIVYVKLYTII